MKTTPVEPNALRSLPGVITMAGNPSAIYHGTPVQMVRQMAAEMRPGMTVRQAVATLLTALGRNRGILIAIPEDAPEEIVAALFVHALIDAGVSRPVVAQG